MFLLVVLKYMSEKADIQKGLIVSSVIMLCAFSYIIFPTC